MKKFLVIILFCLIISPSFSQSLSGGVVKNTVDDKFFGNWYVRGSILGENNPKGFRSATSQIWNLWKSDNVIILENRLSGARGEITVNNAFSNQNGAFLKFSNKDEKNLEDGIKIILIETPEITLKGDEFSGFDTFEIKKYKNNVLYKKEMVKYEITGRRLK